VTFEMMCIMSSAVTTTSFSSRSSRHLVRMASSFSLVCFSLSRSAAAFLKILCFDSPFLFNPNLFDLFLDVLHVGGRVIALMRARAPASSITSIALSGRNRPGDITIGESNSCLERFVREFALWCASYFGTQGF